jgi:(S)-mandelate dehydrogenase
MPELKNFAADVPSNTAAQAAVLRRAMDASFGWDDLRRVRDEWPGTFLVKEIVTLEDSARCAEAGVVGVVVSNHGGR